METAWKNVSYNGAGSLQNDFVLANADLIKSIVQIDGDKIKVNKYTVEDINNLINLLKLVQSGASTSILPEQDMVTAEYARVFGIKKEQVSALRATVLDIINKHNMFLANNKPRKREMIIKNYIVQQLYDIIRDPVNQIQAQSSVDAVTTDAKEEASNSPAAAKSRLMCPGNFCTKFINMNDNMVGKDGIAICATGLKSYFALSNVANDSYAHDPNPAYLKFNITINGKTYTSLSNVYRQKILDYVREHGFDNGSPFSDEDFEQFLMDDAALLMSAFLGLSADNAKELALGKLNANTDTLGMYIFAFSIGMNVKEVAPIMMTPLALKLSDLCKGNLFLNDLGCVDIIDAIQFLLFGPLSVYLFERTGLPSITKLLKISFGEKGDNFQQAILKLSQKFDSDHTTALPIDPLKYIKNSGEYLQAKNSISDDKKKALFERQVLLAIDYINDYIVNLRSLVKNNLSNLEDLINLAFGAKEMKTIGLMLRLNLEIKTDSTDLYTQVSRILDYPLTVISLLKKYNAIMTAIHPNMEPVGPGDDVLNSLIKVMKEKPHAYSLEAFIKDGHEVIDWVDLLKFAYNPLRIFKQAANYKGYLEALHITNKGLLNKSIRYKRATALALEYCRDNHIYEPKLKELVFNNVERLIALILLDYSLLSVEITANPAKEATATQAAIPADVVFNPETLEPIPVTKQYTYNLGSEVGQASFKLLMDLKVIPDLLKRFPNNKFIQGLSLNVSTSNLRGVVSLAYGLNINMLPKKGTYEEDLFNEMRYAFNELASEVYTVGNKPMALQDMFYLYSLCAYLNRVGPRNLTGIFSDYITDGDGISKSIIAKLAKGERELATKQISLPDEVVAPLVTSVYRDGSDILRVKNGETSQIDIYKNIASQVDMSRYTDYENYGEGGQDFNPDDDLPVEDEENAYTVPTIKIKGKEYQLQNTTIMNADFLLLGRSKKTYKSLITAAMTIPEWNKQFSVDYNRSSKTFSIYVLSQTTDEKKEEIQKYLNSLHDAIISTDGIGFPTMDTNAIMTAVRQKINCGK